MRSISSLPTKADLRKRLFLLAGFSSKRWLFPALRLFSLPDPVTLNRLAALLLVFILVLAMLFLPLPFHSFSSLQGQFSIPTKREKDP